MVEEVGSSRSREEEAARGSQDSFGFHLEKLRKQFKPPDYQDHIVLATNKMMNSLVEKLNLPVRYTADGSIDSESYMREKIFHTVEVRDKLMKSIGSRLSWEEIWELEK